MSSSLMEVAMYHYTECGLGNVWLKNGYIEKDTPYGEAVSIHNVEQLHKLIGLQIVGAKPKLSEAEIRFFRVEMDLSQDDMARLLGVGETTIRNWENGRVKIPGPAERLLRALYKEFATGDGKVRSMIDEINQMNRDTHRQERIEFEECDRGWCAAA
jgi:DNA-binding transcriptional regulator YiaG